MCAIPTGAGVHISLSRRPARRSFGGDRLDLGSAKPLYNSVHQRRDGAPDILSQAFREKPVPVRLIFDPFPYTLGIAITASPLASICRPGRRSLQLKDRPPDPRPDGLAVKIAPFERKVGMSRGYPTRRPPRVVGLAELPLAMMSSPSSATRSGRCESDPNKVGSTGGRFPASAGGGSDSTATRRTAVPPRRLRSLTPRKARRIRRSQ
jgi:hypothetical protein